MDTQRSRYEGLINEGMEIKCGNKFMPSLKAFVKCYDADSVFVKYTHNEKNRIDNSVYEYTWNEFAEIFGMTIDSIK